MSKIGNEIKMFQLVYKRTYPKGCGSSSVGRASAFQAECRGSESRLPLHYLWRHGQVVRQKPAKLLPPVRIWVPPFIF